MSNTTAALERLRTELVRARFTLDLDDAARAQAVRQATVQQIDDYILPRLENLDAPLLTVVGGSTGAGKSTLVNSLVNKVVSPASAIRPTTRHPVLLVSPADVAWFSDTRVLPDLARVIRQEQSSTRAIQTSTAPAHLSLVETSAIPRDIAVIDAPDIDSVAKDNRALARQLLAAADLWLFVTTANRYADAAAWNLLDQAAARGVTVGVVLNRVPSGAIGEVVADLRAMLDSRALENAPIFVVEETSLDSEGLLPGSGAGSPTGPDPDATAGITPIRNWLLGIAHDRALRAQIARQTVDGAIVHVLDSSTFICEALANQEAFTQDLKDTIQQKYSAAAEAVITGAADTTLMRSEVLARWQDFVGTSDVFRKVESWFGGFRDKVTGWISGTPTPVAQVEEEIESGVASVIIDRASEASAQTWNAVRATRAGRELFTDRSLAEPTPDIRERAVSLVREWQSNVFGLVSRETPGKRRKARALSLGLNTVTVALMLTVFASTGGILGGEIAIAGGSAVVGQKMLETLFGDQAVRKLTEQAAALLEEKVSELFEGEASRFQNQLKIVDEGTSSAELRDGVRSLRAAKL